MSGVRIYHPDLDTEITVPSSAVPFHQEAGWQPVEGQQDMGEVWPAEIRRFGGQTPIRMRHPDMESEITVAESAVPFHRERGWQTIDEEAPTVEDVADVADVADAMQPLDIKRTPRTGHRGHTQQDQTEDDR